MRHSSRIDRSETRLSLAVTAALGVITAIGFPGPAAQAQSAVSKLSPLPPNACPQPADFPNAGLAGAFDVSYRFNFTEPNKPGFVTGILHVIGGVPTPDNTPEMAATHQPPVQNGVPYGSRACLLVHATNRQVVTVNAVIENLVPIDGTPGYRLDPTNFTAKITLNHSTTIPSRDRKSELILKVTAASLLLASPPRP